VVGDTREQALARFSRARSISGIPGRRHACRRVDFKLPRSRQRFISSVFTSIASCRLLQHKYLRHIGWIGQFGVDRRHFAPLSEWRYWSSTKRHNLSKYRRGADRHRIPPRRRAQRLGPDTGIRSIRQTLIKAPTAFEEPRFHITEQVS